MADVAALILAAGRATRFGAGAGTKAAVLYRDKPLVRWVADAALGSRAVATVVVVGHAAAAVEAALAPLALRIVPNPLYATGMASSLQAGLAALPPAVRGVVVLLADMPLVTSATVDDLIACFEGDGARADAVVPLIKGEWGNPVLLGCSLFPAVWDLRGDAGARRLFAEPGRRILHTAVVDEAAGIDVDTPAALDLLQAAERSMAGSGSSRRHVSSEIIESISSAGSGSEK